MYEKTVKLRVIRPGKVRTDERGRTVWDDTVETAELELVSTQALKVILDSNDPKSRKALERAVSTSREDGVLARDPNSGSFEIIEDDELQAVLDGDPDLPRVKRPADVTLVPLSEDAESAAGELSLVSTQALRKVLGEAPKKTKSAKAPKRDSGDGFDPYNTG
ncbi:MAG: hypothetical protein ACREQZ_16100 [Woeseiaceae bacterium]